MQLEFYQTIPKLKIVGRMNTPEEFSKIGLPEDLRGKTLLDIGCNSGAFMVEAMERGARAEGVENDLIWRVIARGNLIELDLPHKVYADYKECKRNYDVILLLSVLHVTDKPQELMDWAYEHTNNLLIVEINDRLQHEPVNLPKEAVYYGINKDKRTVYHVTKNNK
jgi:2-polyprenyl-3-methyl-5-hydroxy-6-metoxy-1,4-benzoquinol methylase